MGEMGFWRFWLAWLNNLIYRMKTESCPIKLECFSVDIRNAERNYIGYINLPIRAVPIVSAIKAAHVNI